MTAALAAPEVKRLVAELDRVEADGTFSGHACLFGVEDLARDVVEPGAFRATLARRGASGVKMLWHHDPAEPIGRWLEIREDDRGLFVRGRILTDVARGREALALMRGGVLDGLSIGFRAVKGRRDARSGIRRLAEIDLVAGFGPSGLSVPQPLKLAIMTLVARWYENREGARYGVVPASVADQVESLVAPYRALRLA